MENFKSKEIGNLTELQCITYLYSLGGKISIPYGNSEKYDFILEYNSKLFKIQTKHAKPVEENNNISYIEFSTSRKTHNSKGWKRHKYNKEEVDYFCTYYNNKCYLIPYSECSTVKRLRILPPKNNQSNNINYLKDYESEIILNKLL